MILQMLIKLIEQLKIFLIWIEKGDYYLYLLVNLEANFEEGWIVGLSFDNLEHEHNEEITK